MKPPRSRLFRPPALAAAGWALSLLLLAPLACSGAATSDGEGRAAAQRDLLELLPASAHVVGYADVDAVRGSELFDLTVGEEGVVGDSDHLQEFISRTGIDPRRDLHRIAFASMSGDADLEGAVVLAEATFERDRLEEALADAPRTEQAGYTVYTLEHRAGTDEEPEGPEEAPEAGEDGQADEDEGAIDVDVGVRTGRPVILEEDLVVVGSALGVREVLDVLEGGASVRANQELAELIQDVEPAGSEIWLVSAQKQLLDGVQTPEGIPVDKIQAFLMSMDLDEGISLSLRGRTGAEEDAELLGESLRGMLAFGKMMLQKEEPEIFEIIDRGIEAGSSGRDVTIKASLTQDDLATLRAFARERFGTEEDEESVEG